MTILNHLNILLIESKNDQITETIKFRGGKSNFSTFTQEIFEYTIKYILNLLKTDYNAINSITISTSNKKMNYLALNEKAYKHNIFKLNFYRNSSYLSVI